MIHFLPAIDLKDGQCVRLLRGDMNASTVFNDNAGAQAKEFVNAGCSWIHIVDLNGAFLGQSVNGDAVKAILQSTKGKAKTELGGGIRTLKHMENWLNAGIDRLILGTIALKDPALVKQACKEFAGHIAVGIDAKDGFVAVEGWAEVSSVTTLDLAKKFEDAGVSAIIHTDIARDGAMQGPNTEASLALAKAVNIPIIVSGGVSTMADLEKIKSVGDNLFEGVISGRALYDGAIDLNQAITLLEG
ncbi:MAG: 1-(5-phosphoribosyl)-5-[(5-phosphoribosylamino)methylideneamino]imidazole-4-carboxamide isomerase [Alphaproteobacteria bacterium]